MGHDGTKACLHVPPESWHWMYVGWKRSRAVSHAPSDRASPPAKPFMASMPEKPPALKTRIDIV